MMTRKQLILLKIMEECDELSQRCSKAIQFGLSEIQSGQAYNNLQRISFEGLDLQSMLQIAADEGVLGCPTINEMNLHFEEKKEKFEKYYQHSRFLGQVE